MSSPSNLALLLSVVNAHDNETAATRDSSSSLLIQQATRS